MIVVDTNIIAYLLIRGDMSASADELLNHDPAWVAPRLWLDEFLNILAIYERVEGMPAPTTTAVLADAMELMRESEYEVPAETTLAAARRLGCSAYDAQFIALAEALGLPLYTFDQKLIRMSGGIATTPP